MRTESFKEASWGKRWFESCNAFESNIASAKLTYRPSYVNEVFADGTVEDNIKKLGTFVNVRAAAQVFAEKKKNNVNAIEKEHPYQAPAAVTETV